MTVKAPPKTTPDKLRLPELLGRILIDLPSRRNMATDFGNSVHRVPRAVVMPANIEDVIRIVRYCHETGTPIVARGSAHGMSGQAQIDGGFVLMTDLLNDVGKVRDGEITVGPGARWTDLPVKLAAAKKKLPVEPTFLSLSVGGTLSIGGAGFGSHQDGLQIDNVERLVVVIGDGKKIDCSATKDADVFNAVLGGMGQFGVIVGATLKVKPARSYVVLANLKYSENQRSEFFRDMAQAAEDPSFGSVEGQHVLDNFFGDPFYQLALVLETDKLPSRQTPADVKALFKQFSGTLKDPQTLRQEQHAAARVAQLTGPDGNQKRSEQNTCAGVSIRSGAVQALIDQANTEGVAAELFVPVRKKADRHGSVYQSVDAANGDLLYGVVFVRAPANTDDRDRADRALNRQIVQQAEKLGGKVYMIDTLPQNVGEWNSYFGSHLEEVSKLKQRVDPHDILAPNIGIPFVRKA